ncbi:MAG: 4'-phosphopantetheinyl transferase superfamily protein [Bacteroidota bacterium]
MPLSLKLLNDDCIFGMWCTNELLEELQQDFDSAPLEEKVQLKKFKNPNRQIEWMATRLLTYELLEKKVIIDYDEFGKPSLRNDNRQISISHTDGMVAVQISNQPTGVDVEKISGRVAKIAHKFLSPTEQKAIDIKNQLLHMYAYWGAKETIYKIHGRKGLDFKENIRIEPFKIEKEGTIIAHLKKEKTSVFHLNYFVYDASNGNKYMVVKSSK